MSNYTETLQNAGEVILDIAQIISTNGVGFDVTNQLVQIDLYEDIFSPFIKGTITLLESIDLLNLFPLVGEEMITLGFHTPTCAPNHYRRQQFYIYKMSDMTNTSFKSNLYVLHFISIESVTNLNTRISKTFSGKISDIALDLLKGKTNLNTTKQVNVEATPNSTKFIANYWSPMKCLTYITSTSVNANKSPSYLFFENSQGLNFASLETLYDGEVIHTFQQNNYNRDVNTSTGSTNKQVLKDYLKIQDFYMPQGFDYIDRCMGGMYGSQLITIDPITKKYSSNNYAPLADFPQYKHLNTNSLISNNTMARSQQAILYLTKHYGNFSGYSDVTNASVIQQRTSLMKQAEAFKINISVWGRSDYTVGQKVYVELPAKQAEILNNNNTIDNVTSGNYLIAAAHHIINRVEHTMDVELIKDSLLIDINKGGK